MTTTWRAVWAETAAAVGDRAAARWLCETASATTATEFLEELDAAPTQRMMAHLDAMVARVRTGEPLQYVLGRWGFRHLDVMVDRRVLIPRPETELVAQAALGRAHEMLGQRDSLTIVDLGTGSGVLGLSLAAELGPERATIWLTDNSDDALDVARANLAGLGRTGASVRIAPSGSWWSALDTVLRGGIDLAVTNPPYIAVEDPAVEAVVHDWEPHGALYAGADGLDAVREIAEGAAHWLAPGGWLVSEIGTGQGEETRAVMARSGLDEVSVSADLSGHDRVAQGRRPL